MKVEHTHTQREGEGGREGGKEGVKERGKEGGRKEGRREGRKEGGKEVHVYTLHPLLTCSLGSATVVVTLSISDILSNILYNPLCFLRYEDPLLSPQEWHNYNVRPTTPIILGVPGF